MKFRPYEPHQIVLLPESIEELIPEEHIVRAIDLVVEQLDLKKLYESYSEEGQPGYHPKMLLKVLLYGYATGVRSSRKMAEKLESDLFFMYLSARQRPDFRTISDFRLNKKEFIKDYFLQVLSICKEMGLLRLSHIAIDGTKVEANSSRRLMLDKEDLLRLEATMEERVQKIMDAAENIDSEEDRKYGKDKRGDELPEDLRGSEKLLKKIKEAKKHLEENELKRVSLSDPESRIMLMNNRGTDICYNAQVAIDTDTQLIVAQGVTSNEKDNENFIPVYEEVLRNTAAIGEEESSFEVLADAGYYSGKNYLYIEENEIDAFVPDCMMNKETDDQGNEVLDEYDRRNFKYDEPTDSYTCPEGRKLNFEKKNSRNGVDFRIYRCTDCKGCPSSGKCQSKRTTKNRAIYIYENDSFKEMMRQKLLSYEGRRTYSRRMIIEPVFFHLKRLMYFRQFLLKGKEKAHCEFNLLCTAYNIKKLSRFLSLKAA